MFNKNPFATIKRYIPTNLIYWIKNMSLSSLPGPTGLCMEFINEWSTYRWLCGESNLERYVEVGDSVSTKMFYYYKRNNDAKKGETNFYYFRIGSYCDYKRK